MPPFLKLGRSRRRLLAKGSIRRGFEMFRPLPKIQQRQIRSYALKIRPVVSRPIGNCYHLQVGVNL